MGVDVQRAHSDERMERALYVDGWGNIAGGLLGASSLAVFISSASEDMAGGRTGVAAVVTAVLMLLSLVVIPVLGTIPVEATSGVLVYVGLLLVPFDDVRVPRRVRPLDACVWTAAALVSFVACK